MLQRFLYYCFSCLLVAGSQPTSASRQLRQCKSRNGVDAAHRDCRGGLSTVFMKGGNIQAHREGLTVGRIRRNGVGCREPLLLGFPDSLFSLCLSCQPAKEKGTHSNIS